MDDTGIMEKILSLTCSVFDTTDAQIKSKTKIRPVVDARKAIVYLLRGHFKINITTVAKVINKDHSVIGYMVNGAEDLIKHDLEFRWKINRIKTFIGLDANNCPCCGKPY